MIFIGGFGKVKVSRCFQSALLILLSGGIEADSSLVFGKLWSCKVVSSALVTA